jgi:hypothetical protein
MPFSTTPIAVNDWPTRNVKVLNTLDDSV